MVQTSLNKIYDSAKRILLYTPPTDPAPFVLAETDDEARTSSNTASPLAIQLEELNSLLSYARDLSSIIEILVSDPKNEMKADKIREVQTKLKAMSKQYQQLAPLLLTYDSNQGNTLERPPSINIEENKKFIQDIYNLQVNKDVTIREFTLPALKPVKAMLVYSDSLSDKKTINLAILQPLMQFGIYEPNWSSSGELAKTISEEILPNSQAKRVTNFREISTSINGGDAALLIDGIPEALLIDTRSWEHRSVDRPGIEQTVRGGQEAFTDVAKINTGLIKRRLQVNDLMMESFTLGTRSHTSCFLLYLKSVANDGLVKEVRRRLTDIKADYIGNSGMLESFIDDYPSSPFPQALTTERPDRVAAHLAEGRLAIVCDGSPFALVVPVSLFTFFHSGDDFNMRWPVATFTRALRLFAALLGMTLPAMYLALSTFHQEALPTELALAIAGARERVPFPIVLEIILMELSFELIREAGLRVPGALGSTIGIVGAIILGQAAVAANIVSPIMVVIVAMAGLASFTIPDFTISFGARILRFAFIFLASSAGFVGIATGLLTLTAVLCTMKSFGMPYLAPIAPKTTAGLDVVVRGPIYRQENRPDQLNAKDKQRQPSNSRVWSKTVKKRGDD